jgi:hypothetical protein
MGILDQAIVLEPRKNSMNKFIKRIFGIDKVEAATAEAERKLQEATERAAAIIADAAEKERLSKLTAKELANEKKESYIAVLDTKLNKDNVRNGFFELDWNEHFVVELRLAGYQGDNEEQIVDQWFQDLCRNIGNEAGVDMTDRGAGYINVNKLSDGKTEIY